MNEHNGISVNGLDTRLLNSLVAELNIARRNARSYPAGHPLIEAVFQKVITIHERLLRQRKLIVLGVAKDTLMLDGINLDAGNPAYRDLAHTLFNREIGALILYPGLTNDDLQAFTLILGLKRDEILDRGGIAVVWKEIGPKSISISAIRYELFSSTEEQTVSNSSTSAPHNNLWTQFVVGITSGRINPYSYESSDFLDPEIVAEILNEDFNNPSHQHKVSYAEQISQFLRQSEQTTLNGSIEQIHFQRIAALIEKLSPELQRQLLSSSFDIKKRNGDPVTIDIAPHLSPDALMSVIEYANQGDLTIPPLVMGLLQQLGGASSTQISEQQAAEHDNANDAEHLKVLFQEHNSEEYIPNGYLKKLDTIVTHDHIPGTMLAYTDNEQYDFTDLEPISVDGAIGKTLLYFVANVMEDGDNGALVEALGDVFSTYIKIGEYDSAVNILQKTLGAQVSDEIRMHLADIFASRENIEEIINGLSVWGKSVYPQIRTLINLLGMPSLSTLLDHLAEENNMSIRRFMMERIMEFGEHAKSSILPRLKDSRWYYVRNLVIMLRELNDPTVTPSIRPLLRHENDKVCQEAFITLLQFGDSLAEQKVITQLKDKRREIRMATLPLCGACRSDIVFQAIAVIAMQTGFSSEIYEERETAVTALAECGNAQAMQLIARIISSRNLLAPRLHLKLKTACLASLEKNFPAAIVKPLAARIAADGGELGAAAAALVVRLEIKK